MSKSLTFKPELSTVDVSHARLDYLDTSDSQVESLIEPGDLGLINWSDVFDVELDGRIYYHLKALEDGDFIGVDEGRQIYEIRHDPFEIKPLTGTLREILKRY